MSALYEACRAGDVDQVRQLLPTLSIDEINRVEPNGSTSLHAASSANHPQIVKLLLDHGAVRATLNSDGRTALGEAATDEIKQLFPRSFTVAQARFLTDVPAEQSIEWTSLRNGQYGWLFKLFVANEDVIQAIEDITKDERFADTTTTHKIEYFLRKARRTQDPKWLVQAYSAETGLYQVINKAIAQIPADRRRRRDPLNDFQSFAGVFFHHHALRQFRYAGKCYRGMKLSRDDFERNYKVGHKLLIKPFMSTSKSRHIAERFATSFLTDSRLLSVLFIYTIPDYTLTYKDNVALDISQISEYPQEEEVLILPYTSLEIQAVNFLPSGLIEIDFKWYSFLGDPRGRCKLSSPKN